MSEFTIFAEYSKVLILHESGISFMIDGFTTPITVSLISSCCLEEFFSSSLNDNCLICYKCKKKSYERIESLETYFEVSVIGLHPILNLVRTVTLTKYTILETELVSSSIYNVLEQLIFDRLLIRRNLADEILIGLYNKSVLESFNSEIEKSAERRNKELQKFQS